MSKYPGFYYYQREVCCSMCLADAEVYGDEPNCERCAANNRLKVKLLQFSGRLFRHDAIIQYFDTGRVESVPIRCLTFGGLEDEV